MWDWIRTVFRFRYWSAQNYPSRKLCDWSRDLGEDVASMNSFVGYLYTPSSRSSRYRYKFSDDFLSESSGDVSFYLVRNSLMETPGLFSVNVCTVWCIHMIPVRKFDGNVHRYELLINWIFPFKKWSGLHYKLLCSMHQHSERYGPPFPAHSLDFSLFIFYCKALLRESLLFALFDSI